MQLEDNIDIENRLELEQITRQAEEKVARDDAEYQKAKNGPIWNAASSTAKFVGNAVTGVGKGAVNAGVNIFDTITDLGFMAGVEGASYAGSFFTDKDTVDEDKLVNDLQKWRDGMTSFVRTNESDSGVRNFFSSATESVAKFALFYNKLGALGAGKMVSAVGAGAAEGFTDAPEKDLLVVDDALRMSIGAIAPNSLSDFNKAMDPNTDQSTANQLIRRTMSAVEVGLLSAAGEKVAQNLPAAGEAIAKRMPDPIKQKLTQGVAYAMNKSRDFKEWIKSGRPGNFYNFTPASQSDISFDATAIKEGAGGEDLIRQGVKINYDPNRRILNKEQYDTIIKEYEDKLASLTPQIKDSIVSTAKSRGVADDNALGEFVQAMGIDEAKLLNEEGLKDVLRAQAHNIVFEQQVLSFNVVADQFAKGTIDEGTYLDAGRSLYTTFLQRASLLTGAGRTLRMGQEIPRAMQDLNKQLREVGGDFQTMLSAYQKTIDDPEAAKILSDSMGKLMQQANIMGDGPDTIMAAMVKGLKNPDPTKAPSATMRDYFDAVGTTYQANVLSAIPTLVQNTVGSFWQMELQATEMLITGARGAITGNRLPGAPTIREAYIYQSHVLQGYLNSWLISGKAVAKAMRDGPGAGATYYKQQMGNIPEMTNAAKSSLFRVNKTDMTAQLNPVNEMIARNNFAYISTGRPILDYIGLQDATTKTIAANARLNGRWNTALYVDDVFGLQGKVKNIGEAQKAMTKMFRNGGQPFDDKELKAMGMSKEDGMSINLMFKRFQREASDDASDYALDAAMQTPLSPAMKKAQTLLQDAIPGGRVFVPFFQTPVNILDSAMQRAPVIPLGESGALGLPIHPQFYKDYWAGGIRREQAIARATTGMALAQLGSILYENGALQDAPTDIAEARTITNMMNSAPGSIVVGSTTLPLAPMGALGVIMGYGAAMARNQEKMAILTHADPEDEIKFNDAFMMNVASMFQSVKEMPYLTFVEDLAKLLGTDFSDPDKVGDKIEGLGSIAGNLVPYSAAQRHISQMMMEDRSRANSLWENMAQQFAPYMNYSAYNYFGEPIKMNKSAANVFVRSNSIVDDELATVLLNYANFKPDNLKINLPIPGAIGTTTDRSLQAYPTIRLRLSNEQFDQLNSLIAEQNPRELLKNLTETEEFQRNVLRGEINANTQLANALMSGIRSTAIQKMVAQSQILSNTIDKERRVKQREQDYQTPVPAGVKPPEFMVMPNASN